MTDSPQADARIQLDTPLDADVLLPTGVLGQEELSRPYVYTLTMLSKTFDIAPEALLGQMVGIRIKRNNTNEDDKTKVFQGFSGVVVAFSGGELHRKRREFRTYSMRVVPWLSLLDQGAQFRVFQDKDVLQIVSAVLQDAIKSIWGGSPSLYFQMNVLSSAKYPPLHYCVQYGETDFNFVSRLMEQHGLHYFFEQTDTSHKMIIVDGPPYKVCDESPLAFVKSADSRGGVNHWTHSFAPRLRRWVARDRDDRLNPAVFEKSEETVVEIMKKVTDGEQFTYPSGFAVLTTPGDESDFAASLVRVRIQEEESRFENFSGNTVRVSLTPGRRVKIIGVKEQKREERVTTEEEKEYLVTTVSFSATEGSYTDDRPGEIINKLIHDSIVGGVGRGADRFDDAQKNNLPDVNKVIAAMPGAGNVLAAFGFGFLGPWVSIVVDWASPVLSQIPIIGPFISKSPPTPPTYTNSFTGVPLLANRPYRSPSRSAKPRVPGPQTAIVFGTTELDVATDEFGRVKVTFDWDRGASGDVKASGKTAPTSSCFLRVVQGWAGPKWGMQFLPRVGDEVLVEFIDGDPDRPLITGRVYNAVHKPPFDLPKYRLQSGIKTRIVPLDEKAKDKFHMLRFDDTAGSEQVLLRSQKRLDVRSLGSTYETSSGSRFANIGWKDPNSDAQGGDFDVTVGNDHQTHVHGGHYERIEKAYNLTVIGKTVLDLEADATIMVKGTAALNAPKIILEAKQKISLKVGGNSIVIDTSGITIVGTVVKINSGGSGEEAPDADIEDPVDAAPSDTGEPGWLEKHKGGPGGGRKRRHLTAEHAIAAARPGESAAMTAMRNRLNATPTGREAMNVYDRDGVTPVVGTPGAGTFYTPPDGRGGGNTVTMDPTSTIGDSDFVHEINHADTQNSGNVPDAKTMSRQDYINARIAEESHGDALGEQAHQELANAGTPEGGTRFTGPTYDNAAQQGANNYRAAHPDASQSDVDAAGRTAGEQAVNNQFQSGGVPTSTTGQSYPQFYGQAWDRANPPAAGP